MPSLRFSAVLLAISLTAAGMTPAVAADHRSVADFYKAKSITLLIPSGPGGGYDRYGRLVARHISKHIPGQPTIVPQNMPGAGGVVAANYLYARSPKDGTAFAIIQNGVPFKKLLDDRQVRYDIEGFRWLGSVAPAANVAVVPVKAPFRSLEDLFKKPLIVGASGGTTTDLPMALNSVLGTKLEIIKGYKSTSDILLAMERGEVSGLVGIDWTSFLGSVKGHESDYRVLFQMGISRHRDLAQVPLVQESTQDEDKKAVLDVIFASFAIGRSFVTPAIPKDRLAALRIAFKDTMEDADFRQDAERMGAEVNPLTPEEIADVIKRVYSRPDTIIVRARSAISGEG
jgi:tripartite-type tricarboxylate transporter receptor subunit TctC